MGWKFNIFSSNYHFFVIFILQIKGSWISDLKIKNAFACQQVVNQLYSKRNLSRVIFLFFSSSHILVHNICNYITKFYLYAYINVYVWKFNYIFFVFFFFFIFIFISDCPHKAIVISHHIMNTSQRQWLPWKKKQKLIEDNRRCCHYHWCIRLTVINL